MIDMVDMDEFKVYFLFEIAQFRCHRLNLRNLESFLAGKIPKKTFEILTDYRVQFECLQSRRIKRIVRSFPGIILKENLKES